MTAFTPADYARVAAALRSPDNLLVSETEWNKCLGAILSALDRCAAMPEPGASARRDHDWNWAGKCRRCGIWLELFKDLGPCIADRAQRHAPGSSGE
ncbi:MAG: hypothetical protein ACREFC_09595 [Stellaceae bacterium]